MTKFDIAFDYVIENEGTEFVDDPTDRGGATKFGISSRFVKELDRNAKLPIHYYGDAGNIRWSIKSMAHPGFEEDQICDPIGNDIDSYIKYLDVRLAKLIYQKYFWLPIYDQIEDQDICNYIFDMHVQHGKKRAAELAQRAINAVYRNRHLDVDGLFGEHTLSYLNQCENTIGYSNAIKKILIAIRESLFRCIVAHDKSQERFLEGWLKRCYR